MKNYKRLPLEHLKNCRDLGGYSCGGGTMFRYHRLYRSDAPDHLTAPEWKALEEMGVKTVIDLRSESEQKFAPYEAPDGIERISYPLQKYDSPSANAGEMDDKSLAKIASAAFGKSMEDGYQKMVEDAPARIVYLLETICKKLEKGAVLYHCTAGKDRTGVLTAVLYLLCQVSDEDIIADYQVSATYQAGNPVFALIPEEMRYMLASKPETMKRFLELAHQKNYLGLLQAHGLSQETIERLKKGLIESSSLDDPVTASFQASRQEGLPRQPAPAAGGKGNAIP